MIRLLPLLAIMVLLLGLVSLAQAQEGGADTSSDPPVAQQQNSPVELAGVQTSAACCHGAQTW